MEYQFFANGEPIKVNAERNGDKLTLTLADSQHSFEVTELSNGAYLLRRDGKQTHVSVVKVSNKLNVITDCASYAFEVPSGKDGDSFGADHGEHGDKSRVMAPMPGKVVKILVEPGQTVEPKQKLLIVEAMKMENPLVAPFKAEITKINCAPGELVDSDKVLIELKQIT